jgi:hypothetical protein
MVKTLAYVLSRIGIKYEKGMLWPVGEDDFIKFMSNHGKLDAKQGKQFEKWLQKKDIKYRKLSPRSFTISTPEIFDKLGI